MADKEETRWERMRRKAREYWKKFIDYSQVPLKPVDAWGDALDKAGYGDYVVYENTVVTGSYIDKVAEQLQKGYEDKLNWYIASESTNVHAYAWDGKNEELHMIFMNKRESEDYMEKKKNNSTTRGLRWIYPRYYKFSPVDESMFESLVSAESKGRWVWMYIIVPNALYEKVLHVLDSTGSIGENLILRFQEYDPTYDGTSPINNITPIVSEATRNIDDPLDDIIKIMSGEPLG